MEKTPRKEDNNLTNKAQLPSLQEEETSQERSSVPEILSNPDANNVVQLQRLIGNRATAQLLAQRQPAKTLKKPQTTSPSFIDTIASRKPTESMGAASADSIQRYTLSGGDASNLTEAKYASAELESGLKFSTFSSCIGIVGKKGGKIVGAHLVRVGEDGEGPDVDSVVSSLSGIENGMMFGFLGNWEGDIKQGIAAELGIYDWRTKETQSGWLVTWKDDDWQLESV